MLLVLINAAVGVEALLNRNLKGGVLRDLLQRVALHPLGLFLVLDHHLLPISGLVIQLLFLRSPRILVQVQLPLLV